MKIKIVKSSDLSASTLRSRDYMKLPVVTSRKGARAFVEWAVKKIGLGFHPDTPGRDYIKLTDPLPREGEEVRLFSDADAAAFDRARKASFRFLGEKIYEIGLAAQKKLLKERKL